MDVEEGLVARDDQTFLVASMAFLQAHAKRKMAAKQPLALDNANPNGEKQEAPNNEPSFANTLLFETIGNSGDKYFIKLKNYEKFDRLLQSETSIPIASVLSNDDLLPKAKTQKRFGRLFRTRSKPVAQKGSLMSIFRGGHIPKKRPIGGGGEMSQECTLHLNENLEAVSTGSSSGSSNHARRDRTWELREKCLRKQQSTQDIECLSALNNTRDKHLIKQSIWRNFRTNPSSMTTVDKFLLEDIEEVDNELKEPPEGAAFACDNEVMTVNQKSKRLRRPLSKISLCVEDETDSEIDFGTRCSNTNCDRKSSASAASVAERPRTPGGRSVKRAPSQQSLSTFSNFSDELKAHISPEVLQNIISEMIVYLEEAPSVSSNDMLAVKVAGPKSNAAI